MPIRSPQCALRVGVPFASRLLVVLVLGTGFRAAAGEDATPAEPKKPLPLILCEAESPPYVMLRKLMAKSKLLTAYLEALEKDPNVSRPLLRVRIGARSWSWTGQTIAGGTRIMRPKFIHIRAISPRNKRKLFEIEERHTGGSRLRMSPTGKVDWEGCRSAWTALLEAAFESFPTQVIRRTLRDGLDLTPCMEQALASLNSRREEEREAAAAILSRIGKPALPHLVKILDGCAKARNTHDAHQWELCLGLITRLGPEAAEAVPALTSALEKKGLRLRAALALCRIGPPAAPALERLSELVNDPEFGKRSSRKPSRSKRKSAARRQLSRFDVVRALGKLGPKALPVLEKLCAEPQAVAPGPGAQPRSKDHRNRIRFAAIGGIGRIGPAAASAVPLVASHLKNPDPGVRKYAVAALIRMGPEGRRQVGRLLRSTEPSAVRDRPNIITGVSWAGKDARSFLPLIEPMFRAKKHTTACATALARMGTPGLAVLTQGLWSEEKYIRSCALKEIISSRRNAITPAVVRRVTQMAASDPDRSLRLEALRALGYFGSKARPAAAMLIHKISDPSDPNVFNAALSVLARMRVGEAGKSAVPLLIDIVRKDTRGGSHNAARALGGVGPAARSAAPELLKMARKSYNRGERIAKLALGRIGADTPEIRKMLFKAACGGGDPDEAWEALQLLDDHKDVPGFDLGPAGGSVPPGPSAGLEAIIAGSLEEVLLRGACTALRYRKAVKDGDDPLLKGLKGKLVVWRAMILAPAKKAGDRLTCTLSAGGGKMEVEFPPEGQAGSLKLGNSVVIVGEVRRQEKSWVVRARAWGLGPKLRKGGAFVRCQWDKSKPGGKPKEKPAPGK